MRKFIGLISGLLFLSVSYSQPTALVSAIPQKNISSFTDFLKEEAIRERMIHEPGTFNDRVAGPTDSISYTGATTFCSGGNITLTAKYPPTTPGYTYQWTQDGKVINGATSSTYTATTSGVYSVILDDGTTKTQYPSVTVTVNPNPQASFNFNNNNSCSGTTIQFTSNVSGGKAPYAYSWDFGDGQKATTQNPSNQFVSLGCSTTNYSPKLTVIDANGCSNAASQNITVKQAPDVQVKDLNNPFNQFKNCTNSPSANNPNFTVTLGNISPSASCITSYSVDWGDGNTQNGLTSTSFPLSHIYTQLGTFNLNITATSNNGCKNTKTYQVVNQSNPAVGISAPGSTTGCAPSGFWFKLNNYALNSPGTTYTWDFGDNKPKVVWTTQITEDSIFHTFSSNSCTQSNGQFIVQVTASNGCKSTTATVDNITIFQKPVANFNAPVSYCISKAVPFTNTSTEAYNQGSCDRTTNYYWNFGDPGSPQNTSTDESPTHVFSAPGTYTVTLTAEGSCGIDVISKQICIVPNPSSSFTLSNSASCSPLTVTATNTSNTISSCSLPTYAWSVSYAKGACGGTGSWSYTNNTNASSVNPSFIFNDQGTYTITLSVTNACGTVTSSKTVTVTKPPTVTLSNIQNVCGTATVTPTATVTNCGTSALTYLWTFEGGTPATSTSATPGTVAFSSSGTHKITLAVTNECGTGTDSKTFTVYPVPDLTIPLNQSFCVGDKTPSFNFTSTLPGASVSWIANNISTGLPSSSGGNSISPFTTTNTTSSAITSIITVTSTSNGCSNQQSFNIKVNPRPAAPGTSNLTYCQGVTAPALSATYASGNNLNWYTASSGGTASASAPVPGTSATGFTSYYVSQTDPTTTCEGPRTSIVVTVNPTPNISSSVATSTTTCGSATGTIKLNGLAASTNYIVFIDGVRQTNPISSDGSGVLMITGLKAGTYNNIYVSLNNCTSNTAGPLTISDPNPPATPAIDNVNALCSGSTLNLSVQNPTSGVTYQWSGPNGFSGTGANTSINNTSLANKGVYSVTANQSGCTSAAATVNVQINQTPGMPTAGNNGSVCSGNTLTLNASTSTSGSISYSWTGPNNYTSAVQNPTISSATTDASGPYTVTATLGTCTSASATTTVTVNPTPVITDGQGNNPTSCSGLDGTITLNGLTANTLYKVNYQRNGINQTANITADSKGNLTIDKLTSGSYDNIYVSLNTCTSNKVGPFVLADPNPPAVPVVGSNSPVCTGSDIKLTASTTSAGNATWSWTGPNSFSNTAQNPTISAANTLTSGDYKVTVTINGCSSTATTTVTVNPKPAPPVVIQPLYYCLNSSPAQLKATSDANNILNWYNNQQLNNGSTVAPTPSAATAGDTKYHVTQTNSFGCTSDAASIQVTVYPAITGNSIGNVDTICSGNTPKPLVGTSTLSGGNNSFTYQWQQSNDGVKWDDIIGATNANYAPGILFTTTLFRRVVASGPCTNDFSKPVEIVVQGSITNYDISASQTICANSAPQLLNGETPAGGNNFYSYQWESSTDGTTWTPLANDSLQNYQPPVLSDNMYYRRQVKSGSCMVYSSKVIITVNQIPTMQQVRSDIYCNNGSTTATNFSSTPSNHVSYSWTNDNPVTGIAASGIGDIPATKLTNYSSPGKPVTSNISVIATNTFNGVACPAPAMNYSVTVLPTVTIKPISDTTVCTGSVIPEITPVHDADPAKGTVTYNISVSGEGIPLVSRTDVTTITGYTTNNTSNTDMVATITVTPVYTYNGVSCIGTLISYKVTVKPATPNADAGKDVILCADPVYTMKAIASPGTQGTWTQISATDAFIADPSSSTTKISNLKPGKQYTFEWTVMGFASCPSSKDQMVITVTEDLVNTIDKTTQTICSSQQIHVQGNQPTGGSGNYAYQWQESADNGATWKDIPGQTGISLTYIPTQTVLVKRTVNAAPCIKESETTQIIVQPPVTNNMISKDQSICINTAAAPIRGNTPTGANGNFLYQWQSSTDNGVTWNDIPNATGADYDPGVLNTTTQYRRNAGSSLCSGPQSNNSNVVTVTVNPNAAVQLIVTKDMDCAPFNLNGSFIHSVPDNNNQGYQWYVNDNLMASSIDFPGYTINTSGDSATVKLVAISKYGCRNDSLEHKFYTVVLPKPSFTITPDEGCGPLNVTFKNTTPDADKFQFIWLLGNGQTVKSKEPDMTTYQPNPIYGDTTYTVQLKAFSTCDTITVSQSILVKSKPKALFTPSATTGCSPMKVIFSNTSLGKGSSYFWDFGDGTKAFTATPDTISHVFITGVRDTFHVQLVAVNNCGSDTMTYAVVVAPNNIRLDFALNGNEQSGCAPHTVHFINNTKGASSFTWNFGDNSVTHTTKNIDTLTHNYLIPSNYTVTLFATNGCSDTTTTETVTVYPTPHAAFTANQYTACLGDNIRLTNGSSDANSYLWQFGDGAVSTLENPVHAYNTPGVYTVTLSTIRVNDPGSTCTDTARINVTVVSSMPGHFDVSDSVSNCSPFTVTFTNRDRPSVTAIWDMGDGTTATGDVVTHTYTKGGDYLVKLTVTVPGGCTYISTKTIRVLGPVGSFSYNSGYVCNNRTVLFQAQASNTDSFVFDFGDGNTVTTTNNSVFHTYVNGGTYLPSVTLKNKSGCQVVLTGIDTIKADKISSGFTTTQQLRCGGTTVRFNDQSNAFFGTASILWDLGDGTTASGSTVTHDYHVTGDYIITQIVTGISGCSDTTTQKLHVQVNSQPKAAIVADAVTCVNYPVRFSGDIQSADPIGLLQWTISNGISGTTNPFNVTFHQAGDYTVQLIAGTANGCFDTAQHSIHVNPSPKVITGPDANICLGNSTQLKVSGSADVVSYNWNPSQGLNCINCTAPTASPANTTSYVAQGTNSFGCSAWDTTVVTVIQPFHMKVSPNDSVCIGQSTNLLVSGATTYSWSPAAFLNRTDIQNPTASPTVTTRYRVVGYDGYNCFTDTAFVTVAIGQYPTVSLGPDLNLATGTQQQLQTVITNGPIRNWLWTPPTELSCTTCSLPVATVKNDISYVVKVTTAYGCSATDTLSIKVFCKDAQTFIPNAFTPDGDGINDILMVRAKGVVMVKTFRIFNRWGEVVFERSSFRPNDPAFGWDGKVHGVIGGPDVFVYTAEVVCENGATFTYKGNVSIVK